MPVQPVQPVQTHGEPKANAAQVPPAVRAEEDRRAKRASHADETPTVTVLPVKSATAKSSTGVQTAVASLRKGG